MELLRFKGLVSRGLLEIVQKGDRFTGPAAPGEKRAPARATRYRLKELKTE